MRLSRGRAVALMIAVTLMWSIAGVVSRHLDAARSFEVTFWRSAFATLAMGAALTWRRGGAGVWLALRRADRAVWASALCWCVMFTAFMLAITLTTVANVLVTLAISPLITAVFSRLALGHALPPRTWGAIMLAGVGIAWMYGSQLSMADPGHLLGTAVALAVPLAGATNWTILQHRRSGGGADMMPAVLLGALLSSLLTLPMVLPFATTAHDLTLLAGLGLVQLAIPCLLVVGVARVLSAPELSLLSLLEVLFGVAWAWLGAGEAPSAPVLGGGLLVLGALAGNEVLALRPAH